MRLFTALWLPEHVRRHLSAAFDTVRASPTREWQEATDALRNFRFVPEQRWHLTLCFHGDDADPDRLGDRLAHRVQRLQEQNAELEQDTGFASPRLRVAGAGSFRSVLWVGVESADEAGSSALRMLVGAAGSDPASYRAHVTVARWRAGKPRFDKPFRTALTEPFDDYVGPWWDAGEVALVRSEQRAGTLEYRTVRSWAWTRQQAGTRDDRDVP